MPNMARLAPYAKAFSAPQGPGDSRPTATQIIEDQGLVASPDWIGRVVLITGCSPGGLGPEVAKAIHLTGADVYITVRDVAKGKQVANEILADGKPGIVEVVEMDFGSMASVRAGAEVFLRKSGKKLNILINNAGVMFCPRGKTEDGFETHFAANHLGHFYLFHLVKDALLSSASTSFNSRVISVSSGAHRYGVMHFDDLNLEKTEYDPKVAYGQAKLANIYFANELDRRFKQRNVRALSLHPGGIITPLTRHMESTDYIAEDPDLANLMASPAQGAATTVWAAVAKELEGRGGIYLDEVAEAELVKEDAPYYAGGYAAHAFDPEAEGKLWIKSLELVGLSED